MGTWIVGDLGYFSQRAWGVPLPYFYGEVQWNQISTPETQTMLQN